jgi:Uma2 family endonuclease
MGLAKLKTHEAPRFTEEEYLAFERAADKRHVFLDGYVFEMAGESEPHGIISTNVSGQLYLQLRGTPCLTFSKDTKVRSGPLHLKPGSRKGLYSYPDVLVVCGERRYMDEHKDVLLNPTVIIEVLSDSTQELDRKEKLRRYRFYLPDLRHYVLVEQTMPYVDHYARQDNGTWLFESVEGLEGSLYLAAINCRLEMADIYDRVEFPPEPEEEPEPEFPII